MAFLENRLLINRKQKEKIFCIGYGKTGTTSLEKVFKDFGYKVGDQSKGELLLYSYQKRNFRPIIEHCYSADAFQDIPFSAEYLYIHLDQIFTNAKFILTVRENENQWYDSLTRFHSKLWSKTGLKPSIQDLKEANYRSETFALDALKILYNTQEDNIYDEVKLKHSYLRHIENARNYFSKSENFIEINVNNPSDYLRLASFLNKEPLGNDFPWLNKT